MSLKAFHIFFVTVSTLLCGGVGLWGVREYRNTGGDEMLWLGSASLLLGVVLVVYGFWFLRKLKHVSFL